jgi:hypothetical protein
MFRYLALVPLFLVTSVLAQSQDAAEGSTLDGLQKISVKGIDVAYALPGATLAGYTQVLIDPVEVSFHKDWKPQVAGSRRTLTPTEQQKIRADVGSLVYDTFVKELTKGGYSIATAAGPEVLRVRATIVNLYVTAPDVMTPGVTRSYTVSSGEMTLIADLADSDSGELIVRVGDRHVARETGNFTMSSSVSNASDARRAAASWAQILRGALDKAKAVGKN